MKHPACKSCGKMLYKTLNKGEVAPKGSEYIYCRNKDCEQSVLFKKKKKLENKKTKKTKQNLSTKKKPARKGRVQQKRERVKKLLEREKNPVVENTRERLKNLLSDFDSPALLALVISMLAEMLNEQEIVYFLYKKYNLEKLYHFKLS